MIRTIALVSLLLASTAGAGYAEDSDGAGPAIGQQLATCPDPIGSAGTSAAVTNPDGSVVPDPLICGPDGNIGSLLASGDAEDDDVGGMEGDD